MRSIHRVSAGHTNRASRYLHPSARSIGRGLGLWPLFLAAACDSASGPASGAGRLDLPSAQASVALRDTLPVAVRAYDATGREVPPSSLTWTSGDTGIATVSDRGVVQGRALGTTTIAVTYGALQTTMRLKVTPGSVRLRRVPDTPVLAPGDRLSVTAELLDARGEPIEDTPPNLFWSSARSGVARVEASRADSNGAIVIADAAGLTEIVAFAHGMSASLILAVLPPAMVSEQSLSVEKFGVFEYVASQTSGAIYAPMLVARTGATASPVVITRVDIAIAGMPMSLFAYCANTPLIAGQRHGLLDGDPLSRVVRSRTTVASREAFALLLYRSGGQDRAAFARGVVGPGTAVSAGESIDWHDCDNN